MASDTLPNLLAWVRQNAPGAFVVKVTKLHDEPGFSQVWFDVGTHEMALAMAEALEAEGLEAGAGGGAGWGQRGRPDSPQAHHLLVSPVAGPYDMAHPTRPNTGRPESDYFGCRVCRRKILKSGRKASYFRKGVDDICHDCERQIEVGRYIKKTLGRTPRRAPGDPTGRFPVDPGPDISRFLNPATLGACWSCDRDLRDGDLGALPYVEGLGYEPVCEACAKRHGLPIRGFPIGRLVKRGSRISVEKSNPRHGNPGAVKLSQKLASAGSLDALRSLIAQFYYSTPDRIVLTDAQSHWQVQNGDKRVSPIVVRQGKRFVFGVAEARRLNSPALALKLAEGLAAGVGVGLAAAGLHAWKKRRRNPDPHGFEGLVTQHHGEPMTPAERAAPSREVHESQLRAGDVFATDSSKDRVTGLPLWRKSVCVVDATPLDRGGATYGVGYPGGGVSMVSSIGKRVRLVPQGAALIPPPPPAKEKRRQSPQAAFLRSKSLSMAAAKRLSPSEQAALSAEFTQWVKGRKPNPFPFVAALPAAIKTGAMGGAAWEGASMAVRRAGKKNPGGVFQGLISQAGTVIPGALRSIGGSAETGFGSQIGRRLAGGAGSAAQDARRNPRRKTVVVESRGGYLHHPKFQVMRDGQQNREDIVNFHAQLGEVVKFVEAKANGSCPGCGYASPFIAQGQPCFVCAPKLSEQTTRRAKNRAGATAVPKASVEDMAEVMLERLGVNDALDKAQQIQSACYMRGDRAGFGYWIAVERAIFALVHEEHEEHELIQRGVRVPRKDSAAQAYGDLRSNPGLADAAEGWARSLGLRVPARGTAAWSGMFSAWQRKVRANPGMVPLLLVGNGRRQRNSPMVPLLLVGNGRDAGRVLGQRPAPRRPNRGGFQVELPKDRIIDRIGLADARRRWPKQVEFGEAAFIDFHRGTTKVDDEVILYDDGKKEVTVLWNGGKTNEVTYSGARKDVPDGSIKGDALYVHQVGEDSGKPSYLFGVVPKDGNPRAPVTRDFMILGNMTSKKGWLTD
jgi:hypothetical protein